MQTLIERKFRYVDYFIWLTFVGAIFIITEWLRTLEYVRTMHIYWLDAVYAYAVFGLGSVIAVSLLSLGISTVNRLTNGTRFQHIETLFPYVSFGLFFMVWMNVMRLILFYQKISFSLLHPFYLMLIFFSVGCVIFTIRRNQLRKWMLTWNQRLRPLVLTLIILYEVFIGFYLFSFYSTSPPPPVTRINPEKKLPNVIIIVLDSMTSRDMSLYGYHLPTTPNLDRITKTWTVYENAHSTGTGTLAFMPTLLTGRYPYTDEWYRFGEWVRAGEGWINLAQVLQNAGYETTHIRGVWTYPNLGLYHLNLGWEKIYASSLRYKIIKYSEYGLLYPVIEGIFGYFERSRWAIHAVLFEYVPLNNNNKNIIKQSETIIKETDFEYDIAQDYFRKQKEVKYAKPFFVYLHGLRPHIPYPDVEFFEKLLTIENNLITEENQKNNEIDNIRLRYDENIRIADEQVGQLIPELKKDGLYEQSLIIITADHGSFCIQSQNTCSYYSPFLEAEEENIPLLVKYPGQVEGKRVSHLVSNVDILPTVLDVVGITYPAEYIDGVSLLDLPDKKDQRVVYVRRPNETVSQSKVFAALTQGFRLVQREDGEILEEWNEGQQTYQQVDMNGRLIILPLKRALESFEQRMLYVREKGEILNAPHAIDLIIP